MERVVILLGANLGDTRATFERATELLSQRVGEVVMRSTLWRSEAWGFKGATPEFSNQAIVCECELDAEELLTRTQGIESELGRERVREGEIKRHSGERYSSRSIDIDIIFYGQMCYTSQRLTLPHPLMAEREFVLEPVAEILPDWQHPILGRSCEELLRRLKGKKSV